MSPILSGRSALPLLALLAALAGCSAAPPADAPDMTAPTDNLPLAEYAGPYGGGPAFDRLDLDGPEPAIEDRKSKRLNSRQCTGARMSPSS